MQTEGQVPKVELKADRSEHSRELLKDMIEQTEQYRIEKILAMMYGGYEDKVRKKSLDYMLKVWEKLSPEQCEQVINQANQLLNAAGTDNEIKVAVAVALKTFVGVKVTKKGQQDKSFEQIRTDGGLVDIEDEFI
jgi:hypothetical protein